MEIAKEKGETFKDFDKSDYASGTYFEKYETTDYSPVTEKVQQLFEGIHIPDKRRLDKFKRASAEEWFIQLISSCHRSYAIDQLRSKCNFKRNADCKSNRIKNVCEMRQHIIQCRIYQKIRSGTINLLTI